MLTSLLKNCLKAAKAVLKYILGFFTTICLSVLKAVIKIQGMFVKKIQMLLSNSVMAIKFGFSQFVLLPIMVFYRWVSLCLGWMLRLPMILIKEIKVAFLYLCKLLQVVFLTLIYIPLQACLKWGLNIVVKVFDIAKTCFILCIKAIHVLFFNGILLPTKWICKYLIVIPTQIIKMVRIIFLIGYNVLKNFLISFIKLMLKFLNTSIRWIIRIPVAIFQSIRDLCWAGYLLIRLCCRWLTLIFTASSSILKFGISTSIQVLKAIFVWTIYLPSAALITLIQKLISIPFQCIRLLKRIFIKFIYLPLHICMKWISEIPNRLYNMGRNIIALLKQILLKAMIKIFMRFIYFPLNMCVVCVSRLANKLHDVTKSIVVLVQKIFKTMMKQTTILVPKCLSFVKYLLRSTAYLSLTAGAAMFVSGILFSSAPAEVTKKIDSVAPVYVSVHAKENTTFSSETSATVKALPFRAGDAFVAGDILLEFDCRVQKAELKKAVAQLEAATSSAKSAEKLKNFDSISEQELIKARTDGEVAAAEVDKLTAMVDKCTIKAPYDGVVSETMIHMGESVKPGDPLLKIVNIVNLELQMQVPSIWLEWLKTGTIFKITIDEIKKTYAAKVIKINPEIDPVSQTVKITGVVTSPNVFLLPGMSGQADFSNLNAALNLNKKNTGSLALPVMCHNIPDKIISASFRYGNELNDILPGPVTMSKKD